MKSSELIAAYAQGLRKFRDADLRNTDLRGVNLQGANLRNTIFRSANLWKANLRKANLWGADLWNANLRKANLQSANLRDAVLWDADLRSANLQGADLRNTILRGANLRGANLQGTYLDPNNELPDFDPVSYGFQMDSDGESFFAFRTKSSLYVEDRLYEVGKKYVAPYFSTDSDTDCHPGLYFAKLDWLDMEYPNESFVKVRISRYDALQCGYKFRCKRFTVIEDL